jgi:pyridoxamine 5'-phosphate oxidase
MPRRCAERSSSMSTLPTPPPEDPVPVVAGWLAEITASGKLRNPNAMALATADAVGSPSVRMVLLKELAAEGYCVFYTNYGSRKSEDLDRNSRAAAVIYWEPLGRQVRFEGVVVRSPADESDAYFATRPLLSQLNAWSSAQSRPLRDPADLERAAQRKARELHITQSGVTEPVPRPQGWGGFRLWFDGIELWAEGENRFHERLYYRRTLEPLDAFAFRASPWNAQRLQP